MIWVKLLLPFSSWIASRVMVEIAFGAVWTSMLPPPSTGLWAVTLTLSSSCTRLVS